MTITQWYCTCVHCLIPCSLLQTMDAPVEPPACAGPFSTEVSGLRYSWRGRGPGEKATTIAVYTPTREEWTLQPTTGPPPPGLSAGGCASIANHFYCFGGYDGSSYFNDLHKLNLETLKWSNIPTTNPRPICKAGCGLVSMDERFLVCFGGHGIGPTQPGPTFTRNTDNTDGSGWTNEFHLFDVQEGTIINHYSTLCLYMYVQCVSLSSHKAVHTCILSSTHITYSCTQSYDYTNVFHFQINTLPGVWSSPSVKGEKPPPCSSFSFTKVDQDTVVLFGGFQPGSVRVNDLYLFNLRKMVSWCDVYNCC